MRNALIGGLMLTMFGGLFSAALADTPRAVSQSTLGQMGLGGMQRMSDTDGLAVRGKGSNALVWGSSTAIWYAGGLQTSTNSYVAGSSSHGHSAGAAGQSASYAGTFHGTFGADPTGSALNLFQFGASATGLSLARIH